MHVLIFWWFCLFSSDSFQFWVFSNKLSPFWVWELNPFSQVNSIYISHQFSHYYIKNIVFYYIKERNTKNSISALVAFTTNSSQLKTYSCIIFSYIITHPLYISFSLGNKIFSSNVRSCEQVDEFPAIWLINHIVIVIWYLRTRYDTPNPWDNSKILPKLICKCSTSTIKLLLWILNKCQQKYYKF